MNTAERVTAFLMKQIMRISLLLMITGMVFAALKINSVSEKTQITPVYIATGLRAPNSDLFFYAATVLLLITPLIVSLCAGILFTLKKQFKQALISFLVFVILSASVAVHIFITD